MLPNLAPAEDMPTSLLLSSLGAQYAQNDDTDGQKAPCAAPVKNKPANNAFELRRAKNGNDIVMSEPISIESPKTIRPPNLNESHPPGIFVCFLILINYLNIKILKFFQFSKFIREKNLKFLNQFKILFDFIIISKNNLFFCNSITNQIFS
jgi:hypothetical protein